MRAGLFLEGTQTSPDSTTRYVWVCCLYISGLSEALFCDHLSMFVDTVFGYQVIAFSMLSFVFECTVEVIRATQRSLLFPNSQQARAN